MKLLVMNEFHQEYLKNLGISNDRVSIFCNPINFEDNNLINNRKESEYVVFAGRLTNSKGVNELLSSWKEVDQRHNFKNYWYRRY